MESAITIVVLVSLTVLVAAGVIRSRARERAADDALTAIARTLDQLEESVARVDALTQPQRDDERRLARERHTSSTDTEHSADLVSQLAGLMYKNAWQATERDETVVFAGTYNSHGWNLVTWTDPVADRRAEWHRVLERSLRALDQPIFAARRQGFSLWTPTNLDRFQALRRPRSGIQSREDIALFGDEPLHERSPIGHT